MNGDTVARTFIQSTLPPVLEIVNGIEQPFGAQRISRNAEDRQLLSLATAVYRRATAWHKDTIVGKRADLGTHTSILDKQTDIANGVILAMAGSTHNGYTTFALRHQDAHSLRLIVALLLVYYMQNGYIFFAIGYTYRVAITHDGIRGLAKRDIVVGCAIATNNILGAM